MDLKDFIGRPYGKDSNCWTLCRDVSVSLFGVVLPSFKECYDDPDDQPHSAFGIWSAIQQDGWTKVDEPSPGDVIVFRIGRFACHTGMYLGDGDFVHCLRGRNTTVENLDRDGWRDRIDGIYQWEV